MAKTVILIDDDRDDLDILKEAINDVDKSIVSIDFQDPEEALRVITKKPIIVPSYIFIDINMPRVTGDKILKEIRRIPEFNNVTITVLSTAMSLRDAEKYKSTGANFTFQKPVTYASYREILQTIFI